MVRVWARMACRASSQSGKLVPGSPLALEGMSPTDRLVAGIVCLSPALGEPLKGALIAHVVGNMEDTGLNL